MNNTEINNILHQKADIHFEILKLLEAYKSNTTSQKTLINDGNIKIVKKITLNTNDTANIMNGGALSQKPLLTLKEAAKFSFDRMRRVLSKK